MNYFDQSRFVSFIERYVLARASSFRVGYEKDDAWQATLDAKTLYYHLQEVGSGEADRWSDEMEAQGYGVVATHGNATRIVTHGSGGGGGSIGGGSIGGGCGGGGGGSSPGVIKKLVAGAWGKNAK